MSISQETMSLPAPCNLTVLSSLTVMDTHTAISNQLSINFVSGVISRPRVTMPCISRPYPVLTNVVSSITAYDLEFTVTPTHRLCDRLSTL